MHLFKMYYLSFLSWILFGVNVYLFSTKKYLDLRQSLCKYEWTSTLKTFIWHKKYNHETNWHVALHYGDVIMGTIASQITSLTVVYPTVYSDADQRKYQSSASLAFVWGIHRGPVNSPHNWPVTRKMFPFDDVIMWQDIWPLQGRWAHPSRKSCQWLRQECMNSHDANIALICWYH